jgi:hypothetical protein
MPINKNNKLTINGGVRIRNAQNQNLNNGKKTHARNNAQKVH